MATAKLPRYVNTHRLANGATGYEWNNRHAARRGMVREWLGTDLGAAVRRAEELNRAWDDIRRGTQTRRGPEHGTVAWMADRIERYAEHREKSAKLRGEIERAHKLIVASPLGKARLQDITGREIKVVHSKLVEAYGVSKAQRICKWLRALLFAAVQDKVLASNPMEKMRIAHADARQVYWTADEVARVVAKAMEMGRHSIALAFQLGFDTGQRQGDVLDMKWSQIVFGGPTGREIIVQQSKTDAGVRVPLLPEALALLDETKRTCEYLVVSETTGRKYESFNFQHLAPDVIRAAVIEGKKYGDLRRSCVVRLGETGLCTIPQIAAITGHSYEMASKILEVYLPRTTPMARAAIGQLLEFRRKTA